MAISTQLYRFKINLADISRNVYEDLDFRVAQHPSESLDFLITRVLAYALNYQPDLKFSAEGLHTPEEPCLRVPDSFGGDLLWIEIGNPSSRKLHKASKAARKVKVYTYKLASSLIAELKSEPVHRQEEIEIFSFPPTFLESLAGTLGRETRWSLTHNEGSLIVNADAGTFEAELGSHAVG